MNLKVKYTLNEDNEFLFEVCGETDKTTVLNITNHTYFNLSGDYKRDILTQKLKIKARKFSELESGLTGTGTALDCINTPFDFYAYKEIGKDIKDANEQLLIGNGYDHPFIFEDKLGTVFLKDEESGRVMQVITNNPAVVIYTMNYPKDSTLYKGTKPVKNGAVCIETQNLPIGKGECYKEQSILKPGEVYHRYTKYKFLLSDKWKGRRINTLWRH